MTADSDGLDQILRGLSLDDLQKLIATVSDGLPRRLLMKSARTDILSYAKSVYNPNYQDPPHIRLLAGALEAVERGDTKRLIINCPPRHGKGCADSTDVLSPVGWMKHGDLRVGCRVFGIDGRPAFVTSVSDVRLDMVDVIFTNGEAVRVWPEHLWTVWDRHAIKWKTIETQSMVGKEWDGPRGKRGGRARFQLPDQRGVEFSEKSLRMAPYALGVWLGDGATTAARLDMAASDEAVWRRVEGLGYQISGETPHPKTGVMRINFGNNGIGKRGDLRNSLEAAGVFGDKHIPEIYLRSSRAQRLQLLAGLMDTDGHVEKRGGRCRIVTTMPPLRDGIYDLCTTLGYRPYVTVQKAALSSGGIQGRGDVYTIAFQPFEQIPVSLERRRVTRYSQRRAIGIKSIVPVASEPGRCIKIDREDGLYLVGKTLIPTHNTNLASEIFPAWYMGKHPDRFIIAATYSQELANDFGRKVRNQFLDRDFQELFPGARLALDSQAAVRFNTTAKGSYFSVGVGGAVTGRGAHCFIIDDPIKGREEADSPIQRQTIISWYRAVAYTRLMPQASIIIINTRWHEDDLAGWVMLNTPHENWELVSLPAVAEEDDQLGREIGEPLWPQAFGTEDLLRIRRTLGEREWNALYQQRPSAEEGNIIKRSYWRRWKQRTTDGAIDPPMVDYIIMSLDTGYGEKTTNDPSAITVWGIWRDADRVPQVMLLAAVNERWEYPRLRQEALRMYKDYKPDTCVVENKASGISLIQDLRRAGIPVVKYTPDKDKVSRVHAAETLFEQGRVWVPDGSPWAEMVVEQFAGFPNAKHDDLVDSCVMALLRLKDGYLLTVDEDAPEEEPAWGRKRRRGYW